MENKDIESQEQDAEIESVIAEDKVGYRRPPKSTRFRPGQSGNPKGRPKGSLNMYTVLMATVRKKVTINENGKRRQVTKFEAGFIQQANKFASGDPRAFGNVIELMRAAQEKLTEAEAQSPLKVPDQVMARLWQRFQAQSKIDNMDEQENQDA